MNEIKIIIDDLLEKSEGIEREMINIISSISRWEYVRITGITQEHKISGLDDFNKESLRNVIKEYEIWFTGTNEIILQFINDREKEFFSSDKNIRFIFDVLRKKNATEISNNENLKDVFIERFDIQRNLLRCIIPKIKMSEIKIKRMVSGDLIESELNQADYLFDKNFERAAGVITGVALERHLKTLCELHNLDYENKDTIEPLAQELYRKKIIDKTLMKSIGHLASIRNKCSHPEEIKKHEIRELIDKTKKITFLGL